MINTLLFDLDGTLTDPKSGITKSVQYSLRKYGIDIDDLDELDKFIGPPLKESYMKYFSFSEQEAIQAIEYYREYFSDKGMFENKVYAGIPELLNSMKEKGIKLAVATSKPTFFATRILEHFSLNQFFDEIIGSNLDNTRTGKKEIIEYTLNQLHRNNNESLMVGDRKHDIIGAQANSVKSVGVLYGYGNKDEIENQNPDFIAENVTSLGDILNQIVSL